MNHALAVLEFEEIRTGLAFHCETQLGIRRASRLSPIYKQELVWDELDRTSQAYDLLSSHSLPSLGAVHDLTDALDRAAKGGALGGAELFQIAEAISALRAVRSAVEPRSGRHSAVWELASRFPVLKTLEDQLMDSLEGSGEIKDSASAELARLRQKKRSATSRILERIQSYTSGKNRDLLSDPIYTMRDGRYVVPVKVENRGKVRGIVHDTSGSGQTLFVEPEDVLQLGNQLREVEAAERDEMQRILHDLSSKVGKNAYEITEGIEAAGELDLLLSKARLAFAMKASRPQKWGGYGLVIRGGRHPLLDSKIAVPIDVEVGFQDQGLLLTGPNTGGKTVAIKTVGLFALMAQSGLFLPAIDVKLGPFTQVWADIGDEQSLQQSLSTFSAHVKNIAEALQGVKTGALVLLDEIGAGTDPSEGAALAKAILLTLQSSGAVVLASTHYGELKAFAYNTAGFRNASMEFDVKSLRPTYKVLMGAPGASHALRIAERYGLPKDVIARAFEELSSEVKEISQMVEKLEHAQRTARSTQSEADRRIAEARKLEEKANSKLREAENLRESARAEAAETIENALREMRAETAAIFDELRAGGSHSEARQRLREVQERGEARAHSLRGAEKRAQTPLPAVHKGMTVRVEGYPQTGQVLDEPRNGLVPVQIGPLRINADLRKLSPTEEKAVPKVKSRTNLGFQRAQTAHSEIHLRAMRAEDALNELEKFLDEAVLAGLPQIRIVHGKGEGILRKLTQDFLRRNPNVERYRDGEDGEGSYGVTIAYLK